MPVKQNLLLYWHQKNPFRQDFVSVYNIGFSEIIVGICILSILNEFKMKVRRFSHFGDGAFPDSTDDITGGDAVAFLNHLTIFQQIRIKRLKAVLMVNEDAAAEFPIGVDFFHYAVRYCFDLCIEWSFQVNSAVDAPIIERFALYRFAAGIIV